MYICEFCGNLKEELSSYHSYDNVDGNPSMSGRIDEEDTQCTRCWGEYVEAIECKLCGEWTNAKNGDICDECLKKEMTLERAIEFSKECDSDYTVDLPAFFGFYTPKEIEEILVKHILSTNTKEQANVIEYCSNDIDNFRDFIKDKI